MEQKHEEYGWKAFFPDPGPPTNHIVCPGFALVGMAGIGVYRGPSAVRTFRGNEEDEDLHAAAAAAVAGAAARARTDADLVTTAEVRADVERWEHRAFGRKYLQEELIRQNASAAGAGGGDGGHRVAIWGVGSGESTRNSNRDHCSQSQVHRSVPLCDSGFALIGVAGFWACLKGLFCHPNPPRQRLRGDELRRWRARRGGGEGSEAT